MNEVKIKPTHDKTFNMTCATCEDSYQSAHSQSDQSSLIACAFYSLQAIRKEALLYWVNVQADPSLCWSHRSYCRFCRPLAQVIIVSKNC